MPERPISDIPAGDAPSGRGATTPAEPTRRQALVARRAAESRATIPALTLRASIDMTEASGLEAERGGDAPSSLDLVVRACGLALAEHPKVNGAYRDGRFEAYARVNVGFTVFAGDELIVPTVFDADGKTPGRIAAETRALAVRAREGTITTPELSGATFTVSDLGAWGVRSFEAVVIPGQGAALAVGAVEPRPVAREGAVVVRDVMDAELSCDHRLLTGAEAAAFLGRVRELLEAPAALG